MYIYTCTYIHIHIAKQISNPLSIKLDKNNVIFKTFYCYLNIYGIMMHMYCICNLTITNLLLTRRYCIPTSVWQGMKSAVSQYPQDTRF